VWAWQPSASFIPDITVTPYWKASVSALAGEEAMEPDDFQSYFKAERKKRRRSLVAVGGIVLLVGLIVLIIEGYRLQWDWTGLPEHTIPDPQKYQSAKNLWDWFNLLGVLAIPAVVGLGAAWYTAQQGKVSDRENTDNQRETALVQRLTSFFRV
jgi:hypothetical protein